VNIEADSCFPYKFFNLNIRDGLGSGIRHGLLDKTGGQLLTVPIMENSLPASEQPSCFLKNNA
jgi:hypothetical protein